MQLKILEEGSGLLVTLTPGPTAWTENAAAPVSCVFMLCTVACIAVGGQGGAAGAGPGMLLALANAMLARLCLTDSGQSNVCIVMAWKCP